MCFRSWQWKQTVFWQTTVGGSNCWRSHYLNFLGEQRDNRFFPSWCSMICIHCPEICSTELHKEVLRQHFSLHKLTYRSNTGSFASKLYHVRWEVAVLKSSCTSRSLRRKNAVKQIEGRQKQRFDGSICQLFRYWTGVISNLEADRHSAVTLLAQQRIEWQRVLDITVNGTSDVWIKCRISQRALQPFLHWEGFNFLEIANKEKSQWRQDSGLIYWVSPLSTKRLRIEILGTDIQLLEDSPQAWVWYISSPPKVGSTHKVRKSILNRLSTWKDVFLFHTLPAWPLAPHWATSLQPVFSKDSKPGTRQLEVCLFI